MNRIVITLRFFGRRIYVNCRKYVQRADTGRDAVVP
jgi:hypothetical protein